VFTYSIILADNDRTGSAQPVIEEMRERIPTTLTYCIEPVQNIALARNAALQHAGTDYVAFIDDDEFPAPGWLITLFTACHVYDAAGILGPVRPFFDEPPPDWLVRSRLCDRTEYATGSVLGWKQTRTGNVLFRRALIDSLQSPFRPEFGNGGEDQDFFRRMMDLGHRFVWCNEAVVYEYVPPNRRTRTYYFRRALLRGQNERMLLTPASIARSLLAVPAYLMMLPVLALLGEHHVMQYGVRLLDHMGKLLVASGIRAVRGSYLS
jgi:glycosyltransferase involved in cell wall biosynthesis